MLNKTALKSPVFLARIKAAAVQAIENARDYAVADTGNGQPGAVRVGFTEVKAKRTGKPSLLVAWRRGTGLEFFDNADRDITADVLAALRDYHNELRGLAAA